MNLDLSRLDKFSVNETEQTGLEAAIQLLLLREALDQGSKPEGIKKRAVLSRRRLRNDGLLEGKDGKKLAVAYKRGDLIPEDVTALCNCVKEKFSESAPLQKLLVLFEIMTCQPYLEDGLDKSEMSFEIADVDRQKVMQEIAPTDWIETCAKVYAEAANSHSKFWGKILKATATTIGMVLLASFAAPFIGGLIGVYFLGLSGAAAVSAGLALLGGGAIAAGGFGMVGGTVVIGAAFGAAGAGGSAIFLREGGDKAALNSAIKLQALFKALIDLDLMDHILADDISDAFDNQTNHYKKLGEKKAVARKEHWYMTAPWRELQSEVDIAYKVAAVFETAHDWVHSVRAEATKAKKIHRDPRATRQAKQEPDHQVQDIDLRALLEQHREAEESLGHCVAYLKNAHRSYAAVKDKPFMESLFDMFNKDSRNKLIDGHGNLELCLEEIFELLNKFQAQANTIQQTICKVQVLDKDRKRLKASLGRYKALVIKAHQAAAELTMKNEELKEQLSGQLERGNELFAQALALAALHRTIASPKIGPEAIGTTQARENEREMARKARLELSLAFALGHEQEDSLEPLIERVKAAGIPVMAAAEVKRDMKALGLPLGSSEDEVEKVFRGKSVKVHPDQIDSASKLKKMVLEVERERLERAKELHDYYHNCMN